MARGSDRRVRIRIVLGAIGARRNSSVTLFAVAAVAIAAAAIGPMFLMSADDSVLASTITSTPPGKADLSVISSGGSNALAQLTSASHLAITRAQGLLQAPILAADLGTHFVAEKNQIYAADLLARSGVCAHLRILAGSCPTGRNQILISQRSARASNQHVGSFILISESHESPVDFRVVGIYAPPVTTNTPYWLAEPYFSFGQGSGQVVQLDALITSFATVVTAGSVTNPQLQADLAWHKPDLARGIGAIDATQSEVRSLLATRFGLSLDTGVGGVIAQAQHDEDLMSSVVQAIMLQLVVLALLVIYAVGRISAKDRQTEAAFSRRHGFPRTARFFLAVGEPAVLITVALPVGLLIAFGLLELLARSLFVTGTPVGLNPWVLIAAVGTSLAGIGAAAAASMSLWRGQQAALETRESRRGTLVDGVAVILALAGLVALVTKGSLSGSHANPLAALAPGLLAIGTGVIGIRMASAAVRVVIWRTKDSPLVATFLAVRQIGRRPAALRQVLVLTVAMAVVLFGVGSFFVAASNRRLVANFDVGAARVINVTVPPGESLVSAVRRADPDGRHALAAAVYSTPSGELLAVDATRLAAVATWPSDLSRRSVGLLAHELAPSVPAGITFSGSTLQLTTDLAPQTPSIEIAATVLDAVYLDQETVNFGPIVPGRHSYVASMQGDCMHGCRLLNLSPSWAESNANDLRAVDIGIDGIAATGPNGRVASVGFGARSASSWSAQPSSIRVDSRGAAIGFIIPSGLLDYGGLDLSPRYLPSSLPAVITRQVLTQDLPATAGGPITMAGLDGSPLNVHAISVVPTLPLIGNGGTLVDLGLAQRAAISPPTASTFEVWLAAGAPADIMKSLAKDGIGIGSSTLAANRLGQLDKAGLAFAYDLSLLTAPIAALLALGLLIFLLVSDGPRRRQEMLILTTSGMPKRLVRRSLLIESGLVLAVALILGALIGVGADALALASLPQFAQGTGGLPIGNGVPIGPDIWAATALAVVLVVSTLVVNGFTIRSVGPTDGGSQ